MGENVYAKFHHHYWILALTVMRNPMAIQRGKCFEKQEGRKELGKLENEAICEENKNISLHDS